MARAVAAAHGEQNFLEQDGGRKKPQLADEVLLALRLFIKAGLTPMQALQAATKSAAEHLGRADDLGTVAKGKLADLIAVSDNPLESISKTRDLKFVMKNGVVIKQADKR